MIKKLLKNPQSSLCPLYSSEFNCQVFLQMDSTPCNSIERKDKILSSAFFALLHFFNPVKKQQPVVNGETGQAV